MEYVAITCFSALRMAHTPPASRSSSVDGKVRVETGCTWKVSMMSSTRVLALPVLACGETAMIVAR